MYSLCVAASCSKLQQVAASCSKLQQVAASCSKLQQVAASCSKLQQVAARCFVYMMPSDVLATLSPVGLVDHAT